MCPERMEDMSSYVEGQTHQLLNSLEAHGYTAGHLTQLGQLERERHRLVQAYLEGRAEITITGVGTPKSTIVPVHLKEVTSNDTTIKKYKPVMLMGKDFTEDGRITSNIRKVAEGMKLVTPPAELTALLRKIYSNEELELMGLRALIVMHKPVPGSDDSLVLLGIDRHSACFQVYEDPDETSSRGWHRALGFVFLAPE